MRKVVVFLVFVLFVLQGAISQKILDFDSYTIEDGFSSSKANVIIQDRKGFIWVGTWNGLTRFDGYECVVYKSGINDTENTISNREVTALLEDHSGNIWIGTSYGLNKLNPETGEIRIYPFESRILSLYEDSRKKIWVGTWSDGLFKLDPETGETDSFLPNDVISDLMEDDNQEFWVATYQGLVNLNRDSRTFVRYQPNSLNPHKSVNNNTVTQLVKASNGILWIGTWGSGVSKMETHLNKDSLRFTHYTMQEGEYSIASDVAYRLHYDQYDNLWVGTWNDGVSLLEISEQNKSPNEARFYNFKSDVSDLYSLSGNNITALYVDQTGVLWVGSSQLDRSAIVKTGIKRYCASRYSKSLTSQSSVRSFEGDAKGNLWVGTVSEMLHYRKPESGSYTFIKEIPNAGYDYKGQTYQSNSVLSILDTDEGLLVGTDDAGLLFYRHRDLDRQIYNRFEFYNSATPQALPGNKIKSLVRSEKYPQTVWLGTMQTGFARVSMDENGLSFKSYSANNTGLSDNNIRDIVEDENGHVWIATQRGLNRFDPVSEEFAVFLYSQVNDRTINDNIINCLHIDASGNLWIGTNTGLNKKEESELANGEMSVTFVRFPHLEIVSSELIMNILEDDSAHLILGFYEGLLKFDIETETIIGDYKMREYQRIGMERNAVYKDMDGKMFMGGTHGFISFFSKDLDISSSAPMVTFTDLLISNTSITQIRRKTNEGQFYKTVPYTDSVKLSYKDKILTFVFSAMDFKNPERNTYSYKLEGFDTDWNHVGQRNTATYTNVPHGEYVLKVKAVNSDGIESLIPAVRHITIQPPWWETPYAYTFYIAFLLGLLYFFKRYSIIRIKEKGRLMLERVEHEKEQELYELKVHFFTNITHEFRTPLTLILGPAEESLGREDLSGPVRKSLELIQRNTHRLLRLVNQLMEFRKVEKGKMELFLQKWDIVPLLVEMYDSFQPMANSSKVRLTLEYSPNEILAWVDRDKFERILYNLLSNAFKYIDQEGVINITAGVTYSDALKTQVLFVEVHDNGIGIKPEHQMLIFDRFYQVNEKRTQSTGGIGLYLSKTFVDQHHGMIGVESEQGQGSTFRFCIPLDLGKMVDVTRQSYPDAEAEVTVDNASGIENTGAAFVTDAVNKHHDSRPSVLLVEDDGDLVSFVVDGLSELFNVSSARNGKEGLEMAQKLSPDIIVSDIMMPEMDGFEMGKLLRNDLETSHIPLVFLTAKTMREDEIEGLRIGAVDYIYKPFNMVTLRLKVLNILESRGNAREKFRAADLLEPEKITLSSLDEEFLRNAVAVVDKYMDDPALDVEKLSEHLSLSSNQTYRKIKALTGYTAKEFIRVQRLKIAAQLLIQKKRTISEIIYMVGFSSPSYFSRCFKEQYGCTPSEFIEREEGEGKIG